MNKEPITIYTDFLDTYYVPGYVLFVLQGYDYVLEQLKWYYYVSREEFDKLVHDYIKNNNCEFHVLKKPMEELDVNQIYPSSRAYYNQDGTNTDDILKYHKEKGYDYDNMISDINYMKYLKESYQNDIIYCHVHDNCRRNNK